MALKNATNFRDLAANVSAPLRRGVLYRSDHLGALDAEDAQAIQSLGVKRVLDFRGVHERTAAACRLPGVQVHSLAIEPTIVQVLSDLMNAGHSLTESDVVAHMQDTYRGFVRTSTHRFAEFFAHLLESSEPTVFHCTAGKDRTGFAAVLVLRALGARDDEVMRDYLLTNELLKPERIRGDWALPEHAAKVLYGVQPAFLEAALAEIDAHWGGMDGYLRVGLGLGEGERQRLRDLYLAAG
ncbi:tyrosine-protein phosphatase [Ramlibacter sp. PS4R-6]|uniref:tyrosine-protein phosphatase n=1 Tax=Ramlibacter sp. PS4R-6 TaxID=3133438 RepID=UPI0030A2C229